MAAIALRGVTKAFADGLGVQDVTLDILDGECLVVLGPSGSGKSTVLRLIAGLEHPTTGQIRIDDRDVTHEPPQARDLAMVFQHYALYPHKTVRENLAFGLRVRGVAAAQVRDRVDWIATLLGIAGLLDRRPAQLSGGQRQRVALGRALVREPKAFLLDEPLSNLDPALRSSTRAELAVLHRRLGITMVYVTHDQEEAMTLGTRIAIMREGRFEQVDAPLTIFHRPANLFVATFVGSPAMNVWRGAWSEDGGTTRLAFSSFTLALDRPLLPPPGGEVDLGVRPQDIDLVSAGRGDMDAKVEVIERLGGMTVAHLQAGSGVNSLVRVILPADRPVALGDRLGLRLRRDRLYVFDAVTGRRCGEAESRPDAIDSAPAGQ